MNDYTIQRSNGLNWASGVRLALMALIAGALHIGLNLISISYFGTKGQAENASSQVQHLGVYSVDSEYYLTPPENWLEGRGWCRGDCIGTGTYVRRTPGYGIWYLIHKVVFGARYVIDSLVVSQLILFALAFVAWCDLLKRLDLLNWLQLIGRSIFIVLPWLAVFSQFSITEGLTGVLATLLTWGTFRLWSAQSSKNVILWGWVNGLLLAVLIAVRPVTLFLAIAPALAIIGRSGLSPRAIARNFFGLLFPAFMWLAPWVARNYAVSGMFIPFELGEHPTTFDIYRPVTRAYWRILSADGQTVTDFHTSIIPFMKASIDEGRFDSIAVGRVVSHLPLSMRVSSKVNVWNQRWASYHRSLLEEVGPIVRAHRPLPTIYPQFELQFAQQLDSALIVERRLHPLQMLKQPLMLGKQQIIHAGTSHVFYLSAEPTRHWWPLKGLKAFSFACNLVLAICFGLTVAWSMFRLHRMHLLQVAVLAISIPVIMNFVLLVIVLGAVEQRYGLPFLPSTLLVALLGINVLSTNFSERKSPSAHIRS